MPDMDIIEKRLADTVELKVCPFCGCHALYTPYYEDTECRIQTMPTLTCNGCGMRMSISFDEYKVLRLKNNNAGGYVSQETKKDFENLVTTKWNRRYASYRSRMVMNTNTIIEAMKIAAKERGETIEEFTLSFQKRMLEDDTVPEEIKQDIRKHLHID